MSSRIEINLGEGKVLVDAKFLGVIAQIRPKLFSSRLGLRGNILRDELHLLPQTLADGSVIAIQSERQCFPVVDFFANVIADEPLQLIRIRWPLMRASESIFQMFHLSRRDDDFSRVTTRPLVNQIRGEKQQSPEDQEVNQRLSQCLLEHGPNTANSPACTRSAMYRPGPAPSSELLWA